MTVSIEQLKADYEVLDEVFDDYVNPGAGIAIGRLITAIPIMLDVLNVVIAWRETVGDNYGDNYGDELLCDAIDKFTS